MRRFSSQILGAGNKGPCRHFNTSIYPSNQIALFEFNKQTKTRTRSITRLVNTGPDPEHVVTSLPKRAYLLNDMLDQPKSPFNVKPSTQQATLPFQRVEDFESMVGGEQREFAKRHLAQRVDPEMTNAREQAQLEAMLKTVGVSSMVELIDKTVPAGIRLTPAQQLAYERVLDAPLSEGQVQAMFRHYAQQNKTWKTYIGQGWSPCETPSVIANNVLRNPAWNTAYTV